MQEGAQNDESATIAAIVEEPVAEAAPVSAVEEEPVAEPEQPVQKVASVSQVESTEQSETITLKEVTAEEE